MKHLKIFNIFFLLLPMPVWAGGGAGPSIGEVAQNLMTPTDIVTKMVLAACIIVGIALILVALAQYKIHRQSPKLVPLSTPITLLILGLIALLIPYASRLAETGGSQTQKEKTKEVTTLPMPNVENPGPQVPLPSGSQGAESSQQGSQQQAPSNPPSDQGSPPAEGSGGGHWTQQY